MRVRRMTFDSRVVPLELTRILLHGDRFRHHGPPMTTHADQTGPAVTLAT
jgi:hypothetical protein